MKRQTRSSRMTFCKHSVEGFEINNTETVSSIRVFLNIKLISFCMSLKKLYLNIIEMLKTPVPNSTFQYQKLIKYAVSRLF